MHMTFFKKPLFLLSLAAFSLYTTGCGDDKIDHEPKECDEGDILQNGECVPDNTNTETCEDTCTGDNETCDETTNACVCTDGFERDAESGDCVEGTSNAVIKQCVATNITNYTLSGSQLGVIDLETLTIKEDLADINEDAGIVAAGDALYIVNRISFNDNNNVNNVQKITTDTYNTAWSYGVQPDDLAELNPQTMAVQGQYGYLPLLDAGYVIKVDLHAENEDNFIVASVEIPTIAAFDGDKAEPSNVVIVNNTVIVLSQGLNGWACDADGHSQLLAFDLDLQPKAFFDGDNTLDLELCNAGSLVVVDDTLYVQFVGAYRFGEETDTDDGGIEAIDLAAGTSKGLILTEADTGDQDINGIFSADDNNGLWLFVGYYALHYYDLSEDTLDDAIFNGVVTAVLPHEGNILVGAQDGVHVIDTATGEESTLIETTEGADGLVLFTREDSCF